MLRIKHILILLAMSTLLYRCDINDPILIPGDVSYVAFSNSELSIRENKGSLDVQLYLTTFSTAPAEFTLGYSTEGITMPAVEGVDFMMPEDGKVVFPEGMGYTTAEITILDNDRKDGMKQFWLTLDSGTAGTQIGIDGKDKVLISIQDDEHPLKFILGRYRITAASYYGSQYDISHDRVLIEPDADTTKVRITNLIEGISPVLSYPLVATVDKENMRLSIPGGTQWSNPKDNGYYFAFYKGNPDNANDQGPEPLDESLVLDITEPAGVVTINGLDNWGPKWMEPAGTFDGWWWWDYYLTATLEKVEDF